jgi:hypothetical protein
MARTIAEKSRSAADRIENRTGAARQDRHRLIAKERLVRSGILAISEARQLKCGPSSPPTLDRLPRSTGLRSRPA